MSYRAIDHTKNQSFVVQFQTHEIDTRDRLIEEDEIEW